MIRGVATGAVPVEVGSWSAVTLQVAVRFSLVSSCPVRPLPPVAVSVPSSVLNRWKQSP
ncbi:MAG: hypothetical protein IPI34_10305 [bacterium]|nr:hypothetical protein [bacterium]